MRRWGGERLVLLLGARRCDLDGLNRELSQIFVHALRQTADHLTELCVCRVVGVVGGDFLANLRGIEQLVIEVDDDRRPQAETGVLARRQHLLRTSKADEQDAGVGGQRRTCDTSLQVANRRHTLLVGVTDDGRAFGVHDACTAVLDDFTEQLRNSGLGSRVVAVDEDRPHRAQEQTDDRPASDLRLGDEDSDAT